MATLRVFIRWCESIDGVPVDLHTKVVSPELSAGEGVRDTRLEAEPAEEILSYLGKYHYAEFGHVVITLLWQTMMRRASVVALDVDDYHPDEQYLTVKHRPETGTQLKNCENGERFVALRDDTCTLLDDWLADRRPDVIDEHGREPLLATAQGRPHPSTIASYAYGTTRPCTYGECPHDRDTNDCEAAQNRNKAFDCPSSVGPHAIRRGGITHNLRRGVPEKAISDRADVSPSVLDKHYDRRTKQQKMEQRRDYL
jgi:integrase